MSPSAGMMLVNQIMPLIQAAIARGAVKPTGCEDPQELAAEAVAMAAEGLESAERRGKRVPARSVAFYAIQRLKHGRRSGYAGTVDAMSPAATLYGRVRLRSMDEPLGLDPEDPEGEATLHDILAASAEDTDVRAARHLDWGAVMSRLDERRQAVLTAVAEGYGTNTIAERVQLSPARVCQLKESLGAYLVDTWGADGVASACTPSNWRAGLRAGAERRAGRQERVQRRKARVAR